MSLNIPRKLYHFVLTNRMLLLLIAIFALLTLLPVVAQLSNNYLFILEIFFSIILISGAFVVSDNKQLLMIIVLIILMAYTTLFFNYYLNLKSLLILGLFLELIAFIITTFTIIEHVLQYKRVTTDKIFGAICGYLLIGIIFSLLYTLFEFVYPDSFNFSTGLSSISKIQEAHRFYFVQLIYYSYVTISTLGYGDITPISNLAKIFSALEAITGQLYVAILIARLVGLQISHYRIFEAHKTNNKLSQEDN